MSNYMNINDIAKEVRETLKKEFPNLVFSTTIEKYSGGQSLTVAWMSGFDPIDDSNPENSDIDKNDFNFQINRYYIDKDVRLNEKAKNVLKKVNEISNKRNWDKSDPMTDYFNVNYYFHLKVGKWDKPYKIVETNVKSGQSSTSSSSGKSNFDLGDMLRTCGGWAIYKKTLPDNRIVYSAVKGKEVPPNKQDWNLIKGEVYTESGWKWGKWGKFEKWGSISNEEENLNKLCLVLEKYYLPKKEETKKEAGYTQDELKEMIAQLNILANKGNKMAQKQARVLQFLIK